MIGDPPGYEIDKAIAVLRHVWWWNTWTIHRVVRGRACWGAELRVWGGTASCANCGILWERSTDGSTVDLSYLDRYRRRKAPRVETALAALAGPIRRQVEANVRLPCICHVSARTCLGCEARALLRELDRDKG